MNNIDKQYQALLQDILDNRVTKKDRTGTGTISVFGRQIRHKMSDGFPLLTTKKMYFKGIVTELLWFLRGDTNIKYLVDNDCHIWDGDAYKAYEKNTPEQHIIGSDSDPMKKCMVWNDTIDEQSGYPILDRLSKEEFIDKIKTDAEFAEKWGELGPVYGKQWRKWNSISDSDFDMRMSTYEVDQIANSINLLKTDPDSRRNKVSAWNVGELEEMALPPCHTDFQFYTRELSLEERVNLLKQIDSGLIPTSKLMQSIVEPILNEYNIPARAISLMWNQRSVDTFLGLPFNIASYGLLLEIVGKIVNMVPDELFGNLGDTHLYSNHIEQAKEQIGREFTQEEIQEHLQESGMDALMYEARMKYISKLPKRTREPFLLPTLRINTEFWPTESGECGIGNLTDNIDFLIKEMQINDFQIENYKSHPAIKAPLSN